jgi:hypothetical protein
MDWLASMDILVLRSDMILKTIGLTVTLLGPPKEYLQDLITLGALDNEQVAKPLTFLDRMLASRQLFLNEFPGGKAEYDKIRKTGQKKEFKYALMRTWGLETGQGAKWRDIVRVDDSTWELFKSILSGNCFVTGSSLNMYCR